MPSLAMQSCGMVAMWKVAWLLLVQQLLGFDKRSYMHGCRRRPTSGTADPRGGTHPYVSSSGEAIVDIKFGMCHQAWYVQCMQPHVQDGHLVSASRHQSSPARRRSAEARGQGRREV